MIAAEERRNENFSTSHFIPSGTSLHLPHRVRMLFLRLFA